MIHSYTKILQNSSLKELISSSLEGAPSRLTYNHPFPPEQRGKLSCDHRRWRGRRTHFSKRNWEYRYWNISLENVSHGNTKYSIPWSEVGSNQPHRSLRPTKFRGRKPPAWAASLCRVQGFPWGCQKSQFLGVLHTPLQNHFAEVSGHV